MIIIIILTTFSYSIQLKRKKIEFVHYEIGETFQFKVKLNIIIIMKMGV